jgi:hypothetical protein
MVETFRIIRNLNLVHRFVLIYHKVLRTRLFPLQVTIVSKREGPTELSSTGEAKPRRVPYVLPVDGTDLGTYAAPEASSKSKVYMIPSMMYTSIFRVL